MMSDDKFLILLKSHPELWDTVMKILLEHPQKEEPDSVTPCT